jgi:lipopolysaccharide exporter
MFAIFISITGILGIISCLRYEMAILLPKGDDEASNIFGVSIFFALLISVIMIPVIIFFGEALINVFNSPDLIQYLWLVPIMILIGGISNAVQYWNTRTKDYGRQSITRVIGSVFTSSSKIGAGIAGYASGGTMIIASIAGQGIATTFIGQRTWKFYGDLFKKEIKFNRMIDGVKRYKKFPLIESWGTIMNNISWQLPVLLLAIFFSQSIVGFYALSFRIIQTPIALIGSAIGTVYFQRSAQIKDDKNVLRDNTRLVYRHLVALCLFPAIILAIVGSDLFSVIFGLEWKESGLYVQILSVWMFFWFISSPISNIFIVLERQELLVVVHFIILVTRLFSLVVGGIIGNIYVALVLFSATGVLVYGWLTFYNLSLLKITFKETFLIIVRYLIYSLLAAGILMLLKHFNVEDYLVLIATTIILILYYIILYFLEPSMIIYSNRYKSLVFNKQPK